MNREPKKFFAGLKNRFPFRLGTTSFILPAGYAENVTFLGPLVDDVELLFFEATPPPPEEVRRLAMLKGEHDLSYTFHLPLDIHPGSADEALRRASMEPCRRLVAATGELAPLAWILHVPAAGGEPRPEWQRDALERSIGELAKEGVDRKQLCLETLDYPFAEVISMAEEHGLALCIDVGHLLRYGFAVADCLAAGRKHCRVIHLHGFCGDRDHQDISLFAPALLGAVRDALAGANKEDAVLTLEVFSLKALTRSLEIMRDCLP